MNPSPRRGHHRKRISALRLSSDSTLPTLPVYTSPTWHRPTELLEDPLDRPPDYPDSAEEADADTDSDPDTSNVLYIPSPQPSSPRRTRRSQQPRKAKRNSAASDLYLDNLLARSVHALEMSNTLLQSSMSTHSSLSNVLASDSPVDRTLEARAQNLSSRIRGNSNKHDSWMEDLDQISRGVEGLFDARENPDTAPLDIDEPVSQSLPSSGLGDRVRSGQMRRPSLNLRNASNAQLEYSNHDRSHFVSPPPRALTMYVDSTDDPASITLPSTLGMRSTSHQASTPLPSDIHFGTRPEPPEVEQSKRAVDMLSSYVIRSSPSHTSTPSSIASSFTGLVSMRTGRSSSSGSSLTIRKANESRSPRPSSTTTSPRMSKSRSLTPHRASPQRRARPMTPPLEELSSGSSSSSNFHADRTVESLRQILDRHAPAPIVQVRTPRPAFLSPPSVTPVAGTSTSTVSVSRLFTKPRHSSSTRAPSPPRHSSLKNRSAPPTPISPTPPSSMLHVPSIFSVAITRSSSGSTSGASTPKRISFAELPESYAGSKPAGGWSRFRDKGKDKDGGHRGRAKDKGKKAEEDKDRNEDGGAWWTSWLLGAAGPGSGSGLSLSAARQRQDERVPRGSGWGTRPGYGSSLEEWAV